jgi:3-keto-5-aminohexanoate cleavage enzyme
LASTTLLGDGGGVRDCRDGPDPMSQVDPCIVEVALNGITAKATNPNVPRAPAEVAEDALRCIDAGASIVHNHTDDSLWDPPDRVHAAEPYIDAWIPVMAAHPDVLTYPTMGSGGPGIPIEARWGHHRRLLDAGVLRVGLVDPGSVSLGWLDDQGLPLPLEFVYVNTYADGRYMVENCARLRLAPSVSIFDPSFLRVALAFHHAGALPPGAMIKLYFGGERLPFGLPPTRASLNAYLAMLDETGLPWSVAVLGGDVVGCGLAEHALERGGHVRAGLEDYGGERKPTNVELVEQLADVIERGGRRVATPRETEDLLGIPRRRPTERSAASESDEP